MLENNNSEKVGETNLSFIEEEDGDFENPENNLKIPKENVENNKNNDGRRRSSAEVIQDMQRRVIRRVSKACTNLFHYDQIQIIGISESEILQKLFEVFDYEKEGKLNQEKWIEFLKCRLNLTYTNSPVIMHTYHFEERKVDFIEIVESLSYAVCGNSDVTFESFIKIFQTKNVLNKLFRLIDQDLDGIVSVNQVMEFISQLTFSRSGSRLTKENIQYLHDLFRKYVGDEKEIKKSEFSNIIQTKNQFFTDRVFDIFDGDGSGSISLNEFITAMHKFTGENPEDKIRFLFKVYDVDGDGFIQEAELEQVMRACMEENGMKFSDEQIHELTTALFEDADSNKLGKLTYESLKGQLEKHQGLLENLSVSIERWLVPAMPKVENVGFFSKITSIKPHQFSAQYIKNNYVYLIWLIAFLLTNIILFTSRAVLYNNEHPCATICLLIAKSAGQCLNFNCTFIVVVMLRMSLTFLRSKGASSFIPIDKHIYFHKLAGITIFTLALLHTVTHLINIETGIIYANSTIDCDVLLHDNHTYVDYLFMPITPHGLIPGFAFNTGVALMIILIIMVICSMPFVRRGGCFEIFYWTHFLYTLFLFLLIIHAPKFWAWFLVPGIIFLIEQLLRLYNARIGRGKTYISSGILLPSRVTHLIIKRPANFDFHPGDYAFVRIPKIAEYEWHPFTISSSPEQYDAIWLHIRGCGEWTNRLYDYFEQEQLNLAKSVNDVRANNNFNGFSKGFQYTIKPSTRRNVSQRLAVASIPMTFPIIDSDSDVQDNDTKIEVLNEIDSQIKSKGIPISTRKPPLSKMKSMPNVNERNTKRERMLYSRELMRSESVDDSEIKDGKSIRNTLAVPSSNSATRSSLYLRFKPMIIPLQTPDDSPDQELKIALLNKKQNKDEMSNDEKEIGSVIKSSSLEIFVDGPYGSPSGHIFRAQHAVLIGTGIGVTPFASILQSIMRRYWASRVTCPKCEHTWCSDLSQSVLNLQKVDFFWINRDQRSFEWFVHLLSQLEIEQAELGGAMERFLDMHMYITSALQRTDMKAVGLQLALDLLHEKEKRDLITGLKTRTNAGRPNWDKIFRQLKDQNKGKVTVFYCGPPTLARTLKVKCDEYGFSFRKELF